MISERSLRVCSECVLSVLIVYFERAQSMLEHGGLYIFAKVFFLPYSIFAKGFSAHTHCQIFEQLQLHYLFDCCIFLFVA